MAAVQQSLRKAIQLRSCEIDASAESALPHSLLSFLCVACLEDSASSAFSSRYAFGCPGFIRED